MKIAIHGLGRMGMQIARKLSESGHTVIAHNRSSQPLKEAVSYGAVAAYTKNDVLEAFNHEVVAVWLMLPSEITDNEVMEWAEVMPQGSILINGGNSDYRRTKQLSEKVSQKGMHLVDVGVSGGVWGYERGFPLMIGADDPSVYESLKPIFEALVVPDGAYARYGTSGAGHYVKMVHNAIEYGMMQSLGEGYRLLHDGPYPSVDLAEAGRVWQHRSVIESWLNELTRQAVEENPELVGIDGYVAESGEARWALETAHQLGFNLPAIQAAFDVRLASQSGETNFATKIVAAQRNKFGGHNLNGEGKA